MARLLAVAILASGYRLNNSSGAGRYGGAHRMRADLQSHEPTSAFSDHVRIVAVWACAIIFQTYALIRSSGISPASVLRSEEHTSELTSLMPTSSAVFSLKKKK